MSQTWQDGELICVSNRISRIFCSGRSISFALSVDIDRLKAVARDGSECVAHGAEVREPGCRSLTRRSIGEFESGFALAFALGFALRNCPHFRGYVGCAEESQTSDGSVRAGPKQCY
jgi:hypothetical protein